MQRPDIIGRGSATIRRLSDLGVLKHISVSARMLTILHALERTLKSLVG